MESTLDQLPSPLRRNVDAVLLTAACVTKIRLMAGAGREGGGFGFNLLTNPPFFEALW